LFIATWRLKIATYSKFNVLIVDDDIDVLSYMAEEFNNHGYHVRLASSGNEAIEILKKESIDSVISDFRMRNGNGLTILNFVNSMKERPVFFFVSAQSDLSIKLGAHQYFSKPFNVKKLVYEVEKELSKSIKDGAT
jgi:DNA-binding NtrC family response regulator